MQRGEPLHTAAHRGGPVPAEGISLQTAGEGCRGSKRTMEAMELLLTRYSAAKLGTLSPSMEAVEAMLQAAGRAPDHGRLQPWRLILIEGDARRSLGEILAESLARRDPAASD